MLVTVDTRKLVVSYSQGGKNCGDAAVTAVLLAIHQQWQGRKRCPFKFYRLRRSSFISLLQAMLEILRVSRSAKSSGKNPQLPMFCKYSLVFVNTEVFFHENLPHAFTSLRRPWLNRTSRGCITMAAHRRTSLNIFGGQANGFSKNYPNFGIMR